VALSGTLETFSLPDVLRLLSSTSKTGLLALDGDRGRGRIWVRDGAIVDADADRATNEDVEGVAFELLRFADANFEFDSGIEPAEAGDPRPVDDVLAEAESRLAEWREIEAVVPSLDVWARMVAEVDTDRTVSPTQWRVLALVGTGTSGHALAEHLAEGEYGVCRQLRDLVEVGLVEVDDEPAVAVAPAPVVPAPESAALAEPTFVEPVLDDVAVSSLGTELASFVAVGTVEEPVEVSFHIDDAEPAVEDDEAADADEVEDDLVSELSQLSPKAAAAVEATWSDEEPVDEAEPAEEAATAPEAGSDEIDQNLLLRFLSSTKT